MKQTKKEDVLFSEQLDKSVEWLMVHLSPRVTAGYYIALLLVAGIILFSLFRLA